MPSKINGVNFADLVKKEVGKSLEVQTSETNDMKKILLAELDTAHELLLGALARISCLEKEIQKFQPTINTSTSSSSLSSPQRRNNRICRHWIQNKCTWGENCKFSHDNGRVSVGSFESAESGLKNFPDSNIKEKVQQTHDIMETADTTFMSHKVNFPNIQNVLLPSNQNMSAKSPTETSSETIPAAPTMGHKFHCRKVTPSASSPNNTCLSGSARRSTPSSTPKTSHQDVTWHKNLLDKVKVLEEKYADQYSPRMDKGSHH